MVQYLNNFKELLERTKKKRWDKIIKAIYFINH